jgi:hypothetical protein
MANSTPSTIQGSSQSSCILCPALPPAPSLAPAAHATPTQKTGSGLNTEKANAALIANASHVIDRNGVSAGSKSATEPTKWCARYVRVALKAGGVDLDQIGSEAELGEAKNFGPMLERAKFTKQPAGYTPKPGDIAVMGPAIGPGQHPAGHIAMLAKKPDGSEVWISDFEQRDYWGGMARRDQRIPVTFYSP